MMKTMTPCASCSLSSRCLARVGSGDQLWDLARCTVGISALDPNILSPSLPSLFQADVRNEEALFRAFEGVDCVFHVASYGMSGAEKVSPLHATPGVRQSRVQILVLPTPPLMPCSHYRPSSNSGRVSMIPSLPFASMGPNASSVDF